MKLCRTSKASEEDEDSSDEDSDDDDDEDEAKNPKLDVAMLKHVGSVNRVRVRLCFAWKITSKMYLLKFKILITVYLVVS